METHRKKSNRCGAGCSKSASGAQNCWAHLPPCREEGFSLSTEQLLVFFLAVWFFYFFCFQD